MRRTSQIPRAAAGLGLGMALLCACSNAGSATPVVSDSGLVIVHPAATFTSAFGPTPSSLPKGVLAVIPLPIGSAPGPATIAYGSLWVGAHRVNELYRVDDRTGKVAVIELGQNVCGPIRAVAGRIFTGFCDGSDQEKVIDPATNQVVGSFGSAEVFGEVDGALWAASADGTHLMRMNPTTYQVLATYPVPGVEGLVVGSSLWIANEDVNGGWDGTVAKVDPRTGRVLVRVHAKNLTQGTGPYMAVAGRILWMHASNEAALVRIDTTTGRATLVPVADLTGDPSFYDGPPVVGMGGLWLRLSPGSVARLDPVTGKLVATYTSDNRGGGGFPAVGLGSLWVANFDSDSVWRIRVS